MQPPTVSVRPPPIPQQPRKNSRLVLWIVLGCIATGILLVGALYAMLIQVGRSALESAGQTVLASNLRQIGQAAIIRAGSNHGALPPVHLDADGRAPAIEMATIHRVAVVLARDGMLNDASVWNSLRGRGFDGSYLAVLNPATDEASPEFAAMIRFDVDFVTGVTVDMPSVTPIAWTRGLRPDGTWDPNTGVHGSRGGHILFLGGNVVFFHNLKSAPLVTPDGRPTSNILETLRPGTRVVGAGPGTLHGSTGADAK